MKRSIVYWTVIVCLAMATAWAQQPPRSPAPGPQFAGPGPEEPGPQGPRFEELKSALGLTDAQIEQLLQLQQDKRQASRPLFEQIGDKQRALGEALHAGSTDAAALGRFLIDIESLRRQTQTLAETFRTQALALLDSAQRAKLAALEEAAKLQPAIHQAAALDLLAGGGQGPGPGPRGR